MKTWLLMGAAAGVAAAGLVSPPGRTASPLASVPGPRVVATLSSPALGQGVARAPRADSRLTVVAFTSTTCPLCRKYGPTLAALEDKYRSKGVAFVFVNPYHVEPVEDLKAQVKRLGLDGSYVHDQSQVWVKALGAKTTTEAFVLDPAGKVVYRGAVDDQYGIGSALPQPRRRFLADALDAALAGRKPSVPATFAPGCLLADLAPSAPAIPTFHEKIQPIINRSCLSCHRPGGPAPFSLATYAAVKQRAPMIGYVVKEGIMPPWFAAPGAGPWKNDISLTPAEKAAIQGWIEGGMPQGDPASAPTAPEFEQGWTISKPDVVLRLPEPVEVKASGVMPYVNVSVPTNFTQDQWIDQIEVVPGDKRAVHHVLVFIQTPEQLKRNPIERLLSGDALEEVSGFFAAYVPGNSALVYPAGLAKRIPAGSSLRFQLHYTPFGEATTDQTKIGLVFAKQPPTSEVHTTSVANLGFAIPPGAEFHPVTATLQVPMEAKILSFLPHMHVRGRAARYEITREGETRTLLDVPRYDFNWQLNYVLKQPLAVQPGDVLTYTAWYDNSPKNPSNPDPTRTVRFGQQTYDEMHLGYLEYFVPGEKPGTGRALRHQAARRQVESTFKRLDRNGDGYVTEEEAGRIWDSVKAADEDRDNRISLAEALKRFGG